MNQNDLKIEQILICLQKLEINDRNLFQLGHNVLNKSAEWIDLVKKCLGLTLSDSSIDLIICYVYNREEYVDMFDDDSIEKVIQKINIIENGEKNKNSSI